jgi:hypothetical protein
VTKCDKYYASLEGTTAACTDAKEGMKRRARAIPSFTGKGLLEFSTSRLDKILHELCARLDSDSSVAKGGIVNFSHLFWAFSNDVTASFLFGKSLNWLKDPDLSARHDKRAFQAFRYTPLLNFKMYRRAIFAILQSSFMQARIPGGEIIGVSGHNILILW